MIQIPSVLKLRRDVDETRRSMAIVWQWKKLDAVKRCVARYQKKKSRKGRESKSNQGLARVVRKGEKQKVSAGV